jgi:hypothetical protein
MARRKKAKTPFKLSHSELQEAIREYLENGGKIEKVPPSGDSFNHVYWSEAFLRMRPV